MLSTIDECNNAKAVLDPGADRVTNDYHEGAPKGCSRHKKTWYFNTHAEGALDGESEPICKIAAGKLCEVVRTLSIYLSSNFVRLHALYPIFNLHTLTLRAVL